MEKSKRRIVALTAILILLILVAVIVPVTSAWFADNAQSTTDANLTFGTVSVDAQLDKTTFAGEQVVLTPNELLPGNGGASRTLTIKNTGTVPCYARFSVVIKIGGTETDKINLTVSSPATRQDDGYYFVGTNSAGTALSPNSPNSAVTISLKFTTGNGFGNADKNKTVTVDVAVDVTQSAHNGTTYLTIFWNGDGTITPSAVKVNVDVAKTCATTMALPSSKLSSGVGYQDTLKIKNTGLVSCYIRFSVTTRIDGAATTSIDVSQNGGITIQQGSKGTAADLSEFTRAKKQVDGKYFVDNQYDHGRTLSSNSTISIPITFKAQNGLNVTNKMATADISIDVTQSANNSSSYSSINWDHDSYDTATTCQFDDYTLCFDKYRGWASCNQAVIPQSMLSSAGFELKNLELKFKAEDPYAYSFYVRFYFVAKVDGVETDDINVSIDGAGTKGVNASLAVETFNATVAKAGQMRAPEPSTGDDAATAVLQPDGKYFLDRTIGYNSGVYLSKGITISSKKDYRGKVVTIDVVAQTASYDGNGTTYSTINWAK